MNLNSMSVELVEISSYLTSFKVSPMLFTPFKFEQSPAKNLLEWSGESESGIWLSLMSFPNVVETLFICSGNQNTQLGLLSKTNQMLCDIDESLGV